MRMQSPNWEREHAAWVRGYIAEHPQASIGEIAKAANNARKPLPPGTIRDIRQQMQREQVEREREVLEHTVRPRPPLVHQLQLPKVTLSPPAPPVEALPAPTEGSVAASPPEAPRPPPPPPPATAMQPTGDKNNPELIKLRRKRLYEIVEANPKLTSVAVTDQLRREFGVGVNQGEVCEALHLARGVAGVASPPRRGGRTKAPRSSPASEVEVKANGRGYGEAHRAVRERWLAEYLKKHPGTNSHSAYYAVRERFGIGLKHDQIRAMVEATQLQPAPLKKRARAEAVAPVVDDEVGQALVVLGRVMAARGRSGLLVTLRADGKVCCEPVEAEPQPITVRMGKVRV